MMRKNGKREIHTTITASIYEEMSQFVRPFRSKLEKIRAIGSGRLPLGEYIEKVFTRDQQTKQILQLFNQHVIDEELTVILLLQLFNGDLCT